MLLSLKPEMLVLDDMRKDKRFRFNPMVTSPPHLCSVMAVPLLDKGGYRIGIFGLHGFAPQKFSGEMRTVLANLGGMAMKEINLLSEKYRLQRLSSCSTSLNSGDTRKLSTYMDASKECVQLLDTSQQGWQVLLSNQNWIQATGMTIEAGSSPSFCLNVRLAKPAKPVRTPHAP